VQFCLQQATDLCNLLSRFRILTAKSLILRICDDRHYDLKQSVELRQLIRESLLHCVVQPTTTLQLSLRAKSITLQVCLSPAFCEPHRELHLIR
jgi:hypothetical protein